MHFGYLGPVSCVFSYPEFLRVHGRKWLQPEGWLSDGAGVLLPDCPSGSGIHIWRAEITDNCDILVYSYGRKYFISHIYTAI